MNKEERAQRNATILEAFERGDSVATIAESTGVSAALVYAVVSKGRESGQVTRPHSGRSGSEQNKERAATYAALYEQGFSMKEIGEKFGVTGESVRRSIRRNSGVTPDVKTASFYREARYQRFVNEHGDAVEAAFNETHSMKAVISQFSQCRAAHIRRLLEPKAKFAIDDRPSRMFWTKERIVDILKIAAAGRDQLTTSGYDKWRNSGVLYEGQVPPTKLVICWRFGLWNDAVVAAGLKPTESKRKTYSRSWSRDEAVNAVRVYTRECIENNKRPTTMGYEKWSPTKEGFPCRATIMYSTGGMKWSEILHEVYATDNTHAVAGEQR